jgi:predicted RNA binding protein YcfA (HicA-like mRNA interferase family)
MRARELIRYAESHGWYFLRRGGKASHVIFAHRLHDYRISIPVHRTDVPKGLLAKLLAQIEGTWKGPQQ